MRVSTDDAARAIRIPVASLEGHRLFVQWTSNEWVIFVSTWVLGSAALAPFAWFVGGEFLWSITGVTAAFVLGVLARAASERWLNVDRTVTHLRRTLAAEMRAWAWSRGPRSKRERRAGLVAGIGTWSTTYLFMPGARSTLALAIAVGFVARWIARRTEPDDQRTERLAVAATRKPSDGHFWSARYDTPLGVLAHRGNVFATEDGVFAVYAVGDDPWWLLSDWARESAVVQFAKTWHRLAGWDFTMSLAYRPARASTWAQTYTEAVDAPLPATEDWSWEQSLEDTQRRIKKMHEQQRILEVRLGDLNERDPLNDTILDREAQVHDRVHGPGIRGRRPTPDEIDWHVQRRTVPGHVVPVVSSELPERVTWDGTVGGRTVKVTRGERARYVAVLTMTHKMDDVDPADGSCPWLATMDDIMSLDGTTSLRDHVDVVISGRIADRAEYMGDAELTRKRAVAAREMYDDADMNVPEDIAAAVPTARGVESELRRGDPALVCRAKVIIRFVVDGASAKEALRNAEAVQRHLADRHNMHAVIDWAAGIILRHTKPFRPAPRRTAVDKTTFAQVPYQRFLPVLYWAAGVTTANRAVGTPTGPYIGFVSRTRRPVFMNPWHPTEEMDRPGVVLVSGEQGAGKSVFIGARMCDAVEDGCVVTAMEAGDQLQRIAQHPRYRKVSRVLSMSAVRTNPYYLVPDPPRDLFDDEATWQDEMLGARAERVDLLTDALLARLPRRYWHDAEGPLRIAVADVEASSRNPWHVLDRLHELGYHEAATLLEGEAQGVARVLFPLNRHGDAEPDFADNQFVVLSLPRLELPGAGLSPDHWSPSQRWGVAMVNLCAHYASARGMWLPRTTRKLTGMDEMHVIEHAPSGVQYINRQLLMSRKMNEAFFFVSQSPMVATRFGAEVSTGAVCIFRQMHGPTAALAIEQAGIAKGEGYESVARDLRSGEFIFRDYEGRTDIVFHDVDWKPGRREVLFTTPKAAKVKVAA